MAARQKCYEFTRLVHYQNNRGTGFAFADI